MDALAIEEQLDRSQTSEALKNLGSNAVHRLQAIPKIDGTFSLGTVFMSNKDLLETMTSNERMFSNFATESVLDINACEEDRVPMMHLVSRENTGAAVCRVRNSQGTVGKRALLRYVQDVRTILQRMHVVPKSTYARHVLSR